MVYFNQILHTNKFEHNQNTGMQNSDKAWPIFFLQSLVTVLHTCVSMVSKCNRTHFRMEPTCIFEQLSAHFDRYVASSLIDMLKHSVRLPKQCFQFKHLQFHSN